MNIVLFDDQRRIAFLPLAYTRPVAELLAGTMNNRERWHAFSGQDVSHLSLPYLQKLYPFEAKAEVLFINGRLLPGNEIYDEIQALQPGTKLMSESEMLAARLSDEDLASVDGPESLERLSLREVESKTGSTLFQHVWDFFTMNGKLIEMDRALMDLADFGSAVDEGNMIIGQDLHIHESAKVLASVINTDTGPVIIDEGAEVMEGCTIRGPFYLGKHSALKMAAKIYGPTSIGMHCKVGGEVNNSVINHYSNKAHDGFLGNAVIGQWCNLGADSNNSNLKNDYSIVKLWNYEKESFVRSGLQFLGLIMGDHSKCGINTMFNTGTVAGVFCNIYGAAFQPNFIPSFSWGKPGAFSTYQFKKAVDVAQRVMERRGLELSDAETEVLSLIFERSAELRDKFNKTT